MRTAPLYRVSFFGLMVALASMAGGVARAAETTSSRITITVQVYSRTALRVNPVWSTRSDRLNPHLR